MNLFQKCCSCVLLTTRFRFTHVLLLTVVLLPVSVPYAFAKDRTVTPANFSPKLLFVLLKQERWNEALKVALVLDKNADSKNLYTRFAKATWLFSKGDCKKAGYLAQSIIADAELFRPAYRIVAICLVREKRRQSASNLYRRLANLLPEGPERDLVEAEAAALAPDMSPFYTIDLTIQPSSNVKRATSADRIGALTIDETSKAQKGITATGSFKLSKPIFSSDRLLSRVSIKLGAAYDTVTKDIYPLIGLESRTDILLDHKNSIYATPFLSRTFFEGRSNLNQFGLSFGYAHQADDSSLIAVDNSIVHLNFYDSDRDGYFAQSTVSYSKPISSSDRIFLSVNGAINHSANDNYSYKSATVNGEWELYFKNNLITSVGGYISYKKYDSNAALTSQNRVNKRAAIILGLSHRKFSIGTFRPELTYTFTKQWSNDVFHKYDAHDVGIRIKSSF